MPVADGGEGQGTRTSVRLDGCAVATTGAVSEVTVAGDPMPTDEEMPPWAAALAGSCWSARWLRAEARQAQTALVKHRAELERVVDAAHAFASDNDLCKRFDRFNRRSRLRGAGFLS